MNKNTYAQILDTLFQKSLDAIVIIDNMGIIQMANRAITKLFGYQVSETIGANIAIFLQNKIASEQNRDILQHLRPGPKSLLNQTLAFVHKNGTIFSCDISISEVILAEGEQLFAWTIRKVAAQEQPIAIIKALNPTPKEKELNELKTRFITTASHEFRTPLSTILSSAKLLGRYTESAEQEKRLKHIHRIQSAVNNLNLILDDLLTWSKLEEGKINYEPQPFNFKKLVNESMEEVMMIAKKDQQLIYNHHGHNNDIILDPSYLKNILLNLLSNAIKYSRAGDTIELNSHIDEHRLHLQVKDQGIGIALEDQAHLFDRFFRGNNAANIQGTGLGLNIVKKYIDTMNGDIHFESSLGAGSTFNVYIPFNPSYNTSVS